MTVVENMSLTDESDRNLSFEPEGTEGDDEGTEPEQTPSPLLIMALRQQNIERPPDHHNNKSSRKNIHNSGKNSLNEKPMPHKNGGAAKKRRRGKKRHNTNNNSKKKWKPYTELTWEERKEVDEREATRAAKKRENRPTPYNTTQFLMEDHKVETPDFSSVSTLNNFLESSDDAFDDNVVGGFHEKDFTAVYNDLQSERLQSMSKGDLVSEVLALSSKVNELEGIQKLKRQNCNDANDNNDEMYQITSEVRKRLQSVGDLEATVSQLREENLRLQSENKRLVSCSTN